MFCIRWSSASPKCGSEEAWGFFNVIIAHPVLSLFILIVIALGIAMALHLDKAKETETKETKEPMTEITDDERHSGNSNS